ncbi:hypothetical protein BLNAU_1270 [Blattamonas nauphoetae]|uniref:Wings apart-like protein C-terminal domain-containing protein n=1 Tax=Blattamonas nauphoetae TaxID=2049346 RepID=A0ABQ9YIZ6_9EUKA|nr:hypothetical protein BLNAU_1270 [Blattamonas nauphoetae]
MNDQTLFTPKASARKRTNVPSLKSPKRPLTPRDDTRALSHQMNSIRPTSASRPTSARNSSIQDLNASIARTAFPPSPTLLGTIDRPSSALSIPQLPIFTPNPPSSANRSTRPSSRESHLLPSPGRSPRDLVRPVISPTQINRAISDTKIVPSSRRLPAIITQDSSSPTKHEQVKLKQHAPAKPVVEMSEKGHRPHPSQTTAKRTAPKLVTSNSQKRLQGVEKNTKTNSMKDSLIGTGDDQPPLRILSTSKSIKPTTIRPKLSQTAIISFSEQTLTEYLQNPHLKISPNKNSLIDKTEGLGCLEALETIRTYQTQGSEIFNFQTVRNALQHLLVIPLPSTSSPDYLSSSEICQIALRTSCILLHSDIPTSSLEPILHILFVHSRNPANDSLFILEGLASPLINLTTLSTWTSPFVSSPTESHSDFTSLLHLISLLRNITTSSSALPGTDLSLASLFLEGGLLLGLSDLAETVIVPALFHWDRSGGRSAQHSKTILSKLFGTNLTHFLDFVRRFTALIRNLCNSPNLNQQFQKPIPSNRTKTGKMSETDLSVISDWAHHIQLFVFVLPSLLLFPDVQISFNISRILSRISLVPSALNLFVWEDDEEEDTESGSDEEANRNDMDFQPLIDCSQPIAAISEALHSTYSREAKHYLQKSVLALVEQASRHGVDLPRSVRSGKDSEFVLGSSPVPAQTLIRLFFAMSNLCSWSDDGPSVGELFVQSWEALDTPNILTHFLSSLHTLFTSRKTERKGQPAPTQKSGNVRGKSLSPMRTGSGEEEEHDEVLCDCITKTLAFIANLCLSPEMMEDVGGEKEIICVVGFLETLSKHSKSLTQSEEEVLLNSVGLFANLTPSESFINQLRKQNVGKAAMVLFDLINFEGNTEIVAESVRALSNLVRLDEVKKVVREGNVLSSLLSLLSSSSPAVLLQTIGTLLNLAEDSTVCRQSHSWVLPTPSTQHSRNQSEKKGVVDCLLGIVEKEGLSNLTLTTVACRCIVNLCTNFTSLLSSTTLQSANRILSHLLQEASQYESDPPTLIEELAEAANRVLLVVGKS